ncbi:MAG: hypothetical protein ACO1OB_14575 [Archangium sp.]
MKALVATMTMLLLSACGVPRCLLSCATVQTIILRDVGGNPLKPAKVRDASGTLRECGQAGDGFTTCQSDRISFDQTKGLTTAVVRVEATTGEVFEGDLMPKEIGELDADGCGCGNARYEDRTVTLTTP